MWWMEALRRGHNIMLYTGKPHNNTGYRNRYKIATANGPLLLSVPVKGGRRNSAALHETFIDNTHAWQRQHWGALFSAYGRAPFFEHYGPELEALIFAGHESLFDFNLAAIEWLRRSMRLEISITAKEELAAEIQEVSPRYARIEEVVFAKPYHQVFEDRWGFLPDLSAIDLLMNEGPYAAAYLSSTQR
jgi:hypothetical protein